MQSLTYMHAQVNSYACVYENMHIAGLVIGAIAWAGSQAQQGGLAAAASGAAIASSAQAAKPQNAVLVFGSTGKLGRLVVKQVGSTPINDVSTSDALLHLLMSYHTARISTPFPSLKSAAAAARRPQRRRGGALCRKSRGVWGAGPQQRARHAVRQNRHRHYRHEHSDR